MALPAQYAKANFIYTPPSGREMEMVTHWVPEDEEEIDADLVAAWSISLSVAIAAQIKDVLTPDSAYNGVRVTMHDAGTIHPFFTRTGDGDGTVAAGDSLPDHVAVVIRNFTNVPGRPGLGRWFIGGIPESFTIENALTDAANVAYEALGAQLLMPMPATLGGIDWHLARLSRKNNSIDQINSTYVQEFVRRQDRRLFRTLAQS